MEKQALLHKCSSTSSAKSLLIVLYSALKSFNIKRVQSYFCTPKSDFRTEAIWRQLYSISRDCENFILLKGSLRKSFEDVTLLQKLLVPTFIFNHVLIPLMW